MTLFCRIFYNKFLIFSKDIHFPLSIFLSHFQASPPKTPFFPIKRYYCLSNYFICLLLDIHWFVVLERSLPDPGPKFPLETSRSYSLHHHYHSSLHYLYHLRHCWIDPIHMSHYLLLHYVRWLLIQLLLYESFAIEKEVIWLSFLAKELRL